jgi:predicted nucleotidyltransferase
MKHNKNVAMIEVVSKGLTKSLKEKVVFVGGATVSLYLEDKTSTAIRPTDDVDCVIEITSRQNYYDLQSTLEKAGFKHSLEEKAPICRMSYAGLKVDIMPSDTRILGFSNIWYQEGINHAIEVKLPRGEKIKIFPLPYFIAAKIEAYFGRGGGDFRLSSDIEDVVTVLDAQRDMRGLLKSPDKVKAYLRKNFRAFLSDELFLEALSSHLAPAPSQKKRAERLLDSINGFCVGI